MRSGNVVTAIGSTRPAAGPGTDKQRRKGAQQACGLLPVGSQRPAADGYEASACRKDKLTGAAIGRSPGRGR